MICPHCKNINSPKKVISTWAIKSGEVKRKRKCLHCKNLFYTIEEIFVKQVLRNGVLGPLNKPI
jgi:transcriptional regulator NrdR family protein